MSNEIDDQLFNKSAELIFNKYFIGVESWDWKNEDRRVLYSNLVKKLYFVLYNTKKNIEVVKNVE
jgi:hypothetical protein